MQTSRAPGGGRKRLPLETHAMNGNPGKRPENTVEPLPVPRDRPQPPAHFDDESVALWNHFVDAIQGMGVMSSIDAPTLEMLVDSWRGYRQAQANVVKYGMVHAEGGKITISKFFMARRTLFEQCMQLLTQFGFTPVARAVLASKLNGPKPPEDDDPLAAILKRRMERN